MNRIDRNKTLVRHILNCGIASSQKDLGVKLGYANESSFSQIINEKVPYPKNFIERIIAIVPDLNTDWLLYGEGEMFITDTIPRIVEASIIKEDEEVEVDIEGLMLDTNTAPKDIAKMIGEDIEYLRRCNNKLYPHHIMKLQDRFGDALVDKHVKYAKTVEVEVVESFPVLPEAVAIKPNTDLKEYIEENSSELEQVNPGQLLRSADMAERILRNSMYPTFVPGDIVFVQFLDEESKMNDGEIYYIKSRTRTSMIRQVKFEEGGKIRLIAQNERYADVIMPRCDIINVGMVVGMLRLTFGDQYSEMENLRRTKEEQLNRFIHMQGEMIAEIRESGKRNDRLIDRLMER